MEQTKRCSTCRHMLPLENFHRDRARADGHHYVCKACRLEDRQRRPYVATPEQRDRARASVRRWQAANHERSKELVRRAEAKRAGVQILEFTVQELAARLSMFDGCWVCGGPADQVDHTKPVSKGGAHALCNIRPACRKCNAGKKDKWPYVRPERLL